MQGSPARDPIPPLVTCEGCRFFQPDKHNRMAGMGFCTRFNGWNYPMEPRRCREREATDAAA